MSWLFSRALVEATFAATYSEFESSAQLSGIGSVQAFWSRGSKTERFDLSQSGMTCALLTESLGAELLTLYRAGFHVRPTAAHLEDARWRMISGRKCDGSWQMSLPGSYLPRTPNDARSIARRTTLKRWVTKSAARSFQRQTWVLTTFGPDTGFLHTPTHAANYACASMQKWPNCREFVRVFGKPDPTNHEWLMGWPIGWTDLKPLAMDKFQSWRQRHFSGSPESLDASPNLLHPDPASETTSAP